MGALSLRILRHQELTPCVARMMRLRTVRSGRGCKIIADIPLKEGIMSRERQAQWTHRLERLHALRERFTTAHRYDRAYAAYLIIQHVYDLWADEMFHSPR